MAYHLFKCVLSLSFGYGIRNIETPVTVIHFGSDMNLHDYNQQLYS